jgi:hypothetical protein
MTVSHGLFLEQRRVTEEEQLTTAVTMQKSAGPLLRACFDEASGCGLRRGRLNALSPKT